MNPHLAADAQLREFEEGQSALESAQPVARGSALLGVLVTLARRIGFILKSAIAFAVVAGVISFLVPKEYTATITILPPQQNSSLSSTLAMQLAGLSSITGLASGALGLKNVEDIYVAMLKSDAVEDAVIERYGLLREYNKKYYYDARKSLNWHTTIDGSRKDGLIRISYENHNPERAVAVVNGFVDALRALSQNLAITEAAQRRVVFEQQLEKTKNDLTNSEEALKQTEMSTGFVQIDSQARALIESAARLRAQVVAKEVQIQAMHTYAGDGNPELLEQQQTLQGLRNQFNQLVGSNGGSTDDLFLSKGNVPQAALEYMRKLRDVKYNEAIFEILARQLELAKLDEAKEGGLVQIVDPAVTPERRSFPNRTLIVCGATVLGLSLAIVFVLIEERVEKMRANPVEAAQLELLKEALSRKSRIRQARGET